MWHACHLLADEDKTRSSRRAASWRRSTSLSPPFPPAGVAVPPAWRTPGGRRSKTSRREEPRNRKRIFRHRVPRAKAHPRRSGAAARRRYPTRRRSARGRGAGEAPAAGGRRPRQVDQGRGRRGRQEDGELTEWPRGAWARPAARRRARENEALGKSPTCREVFGLGVGWRRLAWA
jgi:hypothetical protein